MSDEATGSVEEDVDQDIVEAEAVPLRRSTRERRMPVRFGDYVVGPLRQLRTQLFGKSQPQSEVLYV